ncbi:MAG TPA: cupredoxin domain-containing protein [Candidatus Binatia bacterium]|nr:cupredoxin domain-containing protein [Candidatus Binatia bacterium]
MRPRPRPTRARRTARTGRTALTARPVLATLAAVVLAAVALAGCRESTPLGFESPPPSLNPNSPKLVARDIAFDRDSLEVAAGTPFILIFENLETVSHNVSILSGELGQAGAIRLFEGVLFAGPSTRWYPVPALAAGRYAFVCDLHPNMRGTLTAS